MMNDRRIAFHSSFIIHRSSLNRTPMSEAYIHQLNCSDGGVPKRAVAEAELTPTGLVGDRQAHPLIHGGPGRAPCLSAPAGDEGLPARGQPPLPRSGGETMAPAGPPLGRPPAPRPHPDLR